MRLICPAASSFRSRARCSRARASLYSTLIPASSRRTAPAPRVVHVSAAAEGSAAMYAGIVAINGGTADIKGGTAAVNEGDAAINGGDAAINGGTIAMEALQP